MTREGGTVFFGGAFSRIGQRTGPGVVVDPSAGAVATGWPMFGPDDVAAFPQSVSDAVADGQGGWYVAGSFIRVAGELHRGLVHIRADKSVDPGFDPQLAVPAGWGGVWGERRSGVTVLAKVGSTLYVGGWDLRLDGVARGGLAALDAQTGRLTSWSPRVEGSVASISPAGSTIYIGGTFDRAGGQPRSNAAAIDAATGNATAFDPAVTGVSTGAVPPTPTVNEILPAGDDVYLAGNFTTVDGAARPRLARVDATTGEPDDFDAQVQGDGQNDDVEGLALDGTTLYLAGDFQSVGGQSRARVAAVSTTTGSVTAFNPIPACGGLVVNRVAVDGRTLYLLGGGPSVSNSSGRGLVDGALRWGAAAIDLDTGQVTPFAPQAGGVVSVVARSGSNVFVGGFFELAGGVERQGAAAVDAVTGAVTSWNPDLDKNGHCPWWDTSGPVDASAAASVSSLAAGGGKVYLSGGFDSVGGQARRGTAAVSASNAAVQAWNPSAATGFYPDAQFVVSPDGSTVYAYGSFTELGGQARDGLAALDPITGAATSWNPAKNGSVTALAASPSTVYLSGTFSTLGGQPRSRVGAVNAGDGAATGWNPGASATARELAVDGGSVFAAGFSFMQGPTTIGGATRQSAAELSIATGQATGWNPAVEGIVAPFVSGLAVGPTTVFHGGVEYGRDDAASTGWRGMHPFGTFARGADGRLAFGWASGLDLYGPASDLSDPSVTLDAPGSTGRPTFSGTAGVATGDSTTVSVQITDVDDNVRVGTLRATRSGTAFSVIAPFTLPPDQYSAIAHQSDAAGNVGRSAPVTFTVSGGGSDGGGGSGDGGAGDGSGGTTAPSEGAVPSVPPALPPAAPPQDLFIGTPGLGTVAKPTATRNGDVRVPLTCSGPRMTACEIRITLRVTVLARGNRIVGVASATKRRLRTIGTKVVRLRGGERTTAVVKLNKTGSRLLRRYRKLKVTMQATQRVGGSSRSLARRSLSIRQRP